MVITTDGHRIDATGKPEVEGTRARLKLAPKGSPAVIAAAQIDWAATDKFNADLAARRAAEAARAKAAASAKPAAGIVAGAGPSGPVDMKIIGARGGEALPLEGGAAAVPEGAPGEKAVAAKGAPADPAQAANLLAALNREMGNLKKLHAAALESKDRVERQIADLEAKYANNAERSAVQSLDQPSDRMLSQARASLQTVLEQIAKLESRMNQIRIQAVDVGGSVD